MPSFMAAWLGFRESLAAIILLKLVNPFVQFVGGCQLTSCFNRSLKSLDVVDALGCQGGGSSVEGFRLLRLTTLHVDTRQIGGRKVRHFGSQGNCPE